MNPGKFPILSGVLALALLPGCMEREVALVELEHSSEQVDSVDVIINRNIDILFVIDDSNSMSEEQDSLATNFDRFINVLNTVEGGLPNVHLAVVSTDVGAGPNGIAGCVGNGDNGLLQNAENSSCGPSDRWIQNIALDDGGRQTNYPGTLAEAFSCIARIGDDGCGFEQPLESMRRALNGSNPMNAGFLRENAKLAVIIISDEDDCSAEDLSLFDSSPAQNSADSELGFLTSFRCFEFGVQCDPDTPRSTGPRQDCVPRADSPYLYDIAEYTNFLYSLKSDPRDVFVAGIIGNPTDPIVELRDGKPHLQASCTSAAGDAAPGIRLNAFLKSFSDENSSTSTICNEDLSDALTKIAAAIVEQLGDPCLNGDLRLNEGEPICTVSDIQNRGTDGQTETIVAKCDASKSNVPCYYFERNEVECDQDTQPTRLQLLVERADIGVPDDTEVVAHCEVN